MRAQESIRKEENRMDINEQVQPIFIVGASRSGTALLRTILNEHPDIYITGETHYFDDLRIKLGKAVASPLSPKQRRNSEDYFMALSHRPYGHQGVPELGDLSRTELTETSDRLGGKGDSYFEAYCKIGAINLNRNSWGEKTPRHVYRINEIVERFPDAKIICMVRDPRAVVTSYKYWKNQGGFDLEKDPGHHDALVNEETRARRSYHVLTSCLLWRGAVRASRDAQEQFGESRVRILRYEDIVTNSEEAVRDLCQWLGEEFSDQMLKVQTLNSSFMTYSQQTGIVLGSVERWKNVLTKKEIGFVEWCCGSSLTSLGYQSVGGRTPWGSVLINCLTWPASVLTASIVNKKRIAGLWAYGLRRLRFALFR